MTEDQEFTSASLTDGKLTLPDTRIVEFSVENNDGLLMIPPRSFSDETGSTVIDFTGWDIQGTWHIRKIPVAPGYDAASGIELDEYMVRMYLLKTDGRYLPYVGSRPSLPIVQERKAPVLGNQFFASGQQQLLAGEIIPVIIPAFGERRQYVGTSAISAGTEGVLYHFQVYRENAAIFETIQDSLNYPANYAYRGNAFYFPENVPSRSEAGLPKYSYYWRVRASYKIEDDSGNLYWSNWSQSFPFTVNIPPGAPFDLTVSA